MREILRRNALSSPDRIRLGSVLIIPAPRQDF
jgi:hypothetical protein